MDGEMKSWSSSSTTLDSPRPTLGKREETRRLRLPIQLCTLKRVGGSGAWSRPLSSQDYPSGAIGPLWALMATHRRDEFPNLAKLAALELCCLVQTADCERDLSAQNRILTALRNRLKPLTQKKLLFVKLSTVIPEDALATWKVVKQRDIITCNAPLIFFFGV